MTAAQKKQRVQHLRKRGYGLRTISKETGLKLKEVNEILGIDDTYISPVFSKVHTGDDRDPTGMFHKISTMKWTETTCIHISQNL